MKQVQKEILKMAAAFKPVPATLLDVGCGNGLFTRELCKSLPNTAVSALDRAFPKYLIGLESVSFVFGRAEKLPFDEYAFDMITASMSLHHWGDKKRGLAEAYRVLKEGGRIIIGDPLLQGWLGNPFFGWLVQKIDGGSFATAPELRSYLRDVGFESVNISVAPRSARSQFLVTAFKPSS